MQYNPPTLEDISAARRVLRFLLMVSFHRPDNALYVVAAEWLGVPVSRDALERSEILLQKLEERIITDSAREYSLNLPAARS